MREWLGPDHPAVRKLMSKEGPAELARRLVTESKLADPAARLALWKGGSAAIAASTDPMIMLARSIDPDARVVRKAYEDGVEAPCASRRKRSPSCASPRSAPVCTRTRRSRCASITHRAGLERERHAGRTVHPSVARLRTRHRRGSVRIPDSWMRVKDRLDMNTPFNLSTKQRYRRRQLRQAR